MSDSPACVTCGICCHSSSIAYVRVTGEDWERLGDGAEQWAHFIGHRAFMRMEAGHCAALRVVEDVGEGNTFWCSVYDRRPAVCRDLDRGSPACEAERFRKAEAVLP